MCLGKSNQRINLTNANTRKSSLKSGHTYYDSATKKYRHIPTETRDPLPTEFSSIADKFKYNWKTDKTPHVNDKFLQAVHDMATKHGFDPDDLMAVMAWESWIDPTKKNSAGGSATGLIQIVESTAEGLGTTTADLKNMSAVEQLAYVEKHIFSGSKSPKTLGDIYMAVLWPVGKGKDNDYPLWEKGGKQDKNYNANSGLDINKDGRVTKGEAVQRVIDRRDQNFDKK